MTEDEQTDPSLPEKISSLVDSLLALGLNEPALFKRKENIKRPENCKLLRVTKVNSEIWDIAQKTTRSMDVRFQKVQESLVKGIIPIARFMGTTGEILEKEGTMPSPDEFWKGLSNSVLLVASATYELNMCRRDLFKVDLDDTYKAICSSKEPVGLELLAMTLQNDLKRSKKATKPRNNSLATRGSAMRSILDPPIQPGALFYSIAGGITIRDTPEGETITSSITKTTGVRTTPPGGRNL